MSTFESFVLNIETAQSGSKPDWVSFSCPKCSTGIVVESPDHLPNLSLECYNCKLDIPTRAITLLFRMLEEEKKKTNPAEGSTTSRNATFVRLDNTNVKHHSGKKYLRTIKSPVDGREIEVDVYAVAKAFGVLTAPHTHALKKVLCPGLRGKNSRKKDLEESIDAIRRAIQEEEEEKPVFDPPGNSPPTALEQWAWEQAKRMSDNIEAGFTRIFKRADPPKEPDPIHRLEDDGGKPPPDERYVSEGDILTLKTRYGLCDNDVLKRWAALSGNGAKGEIALLLLELEHLKSQKSKP